VATAPRRIRLKWLKKAQAARKYYAKCRKRYGVHLKHQPGSHHMGFTSGPGPIIPPPVSSSIPPPVASPLSDYADREISTNPELLVMMNPGRRHFSRGVGSLSIRHRRHNMRRRRRNYPITAKVGGRKHTWKKLVRKFGVKRAAKLWRKGKRYHGYTKTRCMNRGRRGCRGGAKSYRALVRRHGVKIAARMWRKRGRR
jgi:hypothetical protein